VPIVSMLVGLELVVSIFIGLGPVVSMLVVSMFVGLELVVSMLVVLMFVGLELVVSMLVVSMLVGLGLVVSMIVSTIVVFLFVVSMFIVLLNEELYLKKQMPPGHKSFTYTPSVRSFAWVHIPSYAVQVLLIKTLSVILYFL